MSSPIRHSSTLSTLTPVQEQIVAFLARGQTVTAAAAASSVHRSSIHNWLQSQPAFTSAVRRAREEYRSGISEELLEMSKSAVATLRQLLEDPATPAAARVKIALAILARAESSPESYAPSDSPPSPREDSRSSGTPRNAPCPCGSGEKYKRCCGKSAPPALGFVSQSAIGDS